MHRLSFGPLAALGVTTMVIATLGSCRGERRVTSTSPDRLQRLVDSLQGPVARVTGLHFKSPPRSALRSRSEVRDYLIRKLDQELPPERMQGLQTAYRMFGLLPDTLELRSLLLDLYTEQVAGYYDPDSATLFGVEGADPAQLRLVLAHEMVHALQGQYLPLDSILHETRNNDRLTAAQAVLEGQATLASIDVLASGRNVSGDPEFWDMYRQQVREQQSAMPVFARAPLIVKEALIFPYLAGAEFMHWWAGSRWKDSVPYGPRMPVSTEQILSPERYARGDQPISLAFPSDTAVMYEDVLGEGEIRVLMAQLAGSSEVRIKLPIGWGGDRYRVYRTTEGPALVWYVVWDDTRSAERFLWGYGGKLRETSRPGYRATVENEELEGKPATVYVLAPERWAEWGRIPKAYITRGDPSLRSG